MKNRNKDWSTSAQPQPTEATPLNQANQAATDPPTTKMDTETKKVLIKVVIDVVLLCCGEFQLNLTHKKIHK